METENRRGLGRYARANLIEPPLEWKLHIVDADRQCGQNLIEPPLEWKQRTAAFTESGVVNNLIEPPLEWKPNTCFRVSQSSAESNRTTAGMETQIDEGDVLQLVRNLIEPPLEWKHEAGPRPAERGGNLIEPPLEWKLCRMAEDQFRVSQNLIEPPLEWKPQNAVLCTCVER